jgi:RIO-like serine/threonine protein kinase
MVGCIIESRKTFDDLFLATAHGMLYILCGIVHGDISCNNIRVYLLSEFEPIGVLMDFDNRTDTWEPPTLTSEERKSLTPPKEHLKQKAKIHLDNAIARLKRIEKEKNNSEPNVSVLAHNSL